MVGDIGQRLGNYRLIRLLGQGGFAQVYLGEHLRLGTQAAIKLLATHLSSNDAEKFLAEARTIARLEHPHIVRILDFDVENDIPFFVMSYAPNGTMRQRYPKGTRLPLDVALTYFKQAASALQYAHDEKLIHRDIKPENMLLGRHNELLLSDFGIAVVAHSSRSQGVQEIVGTIAYMAPEQIQGKPRPASDQYSLAVIVYEWLCGRHPFYGTAAEIATQHLHAPPPPLHQHVSDLPAAIGAVVLKALEKDPHRRFASMQEFADAFEQACRDYLPMTSELSTSAAKLPVTMPEPSPERSSFHSSFTMAVTRPQPLQEEKRGGSRRVFLASVLGIIGLAEVGGGLALWALAHPAQQSAPGSTLVTYTGHSNALSSVSWSPVGERIASGSSDQTVQVWDAASGAHPLVYRGHTTNVNALAWSPGTTNQRIASGGGNDFFKGEHVVQVWDALTGIHLQTYNGHTAPVSSLAWSPDGTRIVSGSEDKTAQIWDAGTGGLLVAYSRHTAAISSVTWSPGGKYIASASADATVQVWDALTAAPLLTLKHAVPINAVAWSPDGTRIASAYGNLFFGNTHGVQIWDAIKGTLLLTYTDHTSPVTTVAWSPDSKHIASASTSPEKVVRVWDAASGTSVLTYRGHTLGVNSVSWSPDGKRIASASLDGTARVWQVF
ncbi:MAG TPA: serine/threonine-protein kinase [Ktedonosporobacter sp.]|jgi:WD40 repeat protein|nr:serine/threonine-protein kinase [Ktedonosporobacter sp.]